MSLFLLFCCWSGRERKKMKNKWTSWHFSCNLVINRFPAGGCTYKAAKGWVCSRIVTTITSNISTFLWKYKIIFCIEKILSSAKQSWQITKFFPASYPGVDLKIFSLDYFYGRILIVKILNINIDDTGLASCQLQIVLLNTPHRLYLETVKTVLWTKLTDLDLIYKKLPSHLAHVRGPAEQ